ncbi:MAG: FtsX-like permease family protein [Verrucomicrobia bacterium]|nr:FtsX-like permease family protein [Verrucomicrobiota bacterium]
MAEFLPFPLEISISWTALLAGLCFGWIVAVLFALLPLLRVRSISPLMAIRAGIDLPKSRWPGWSSVAVIATLATLLIGFALWQTRSTVYGLVFLCSIGCRLCFTDRAFPWVACFSAAVHAGESSLQLAIGTFRAVSPGQSHRVPHGHSGHGSVFAEHIVSYKSILTGSGAPDGAEDAANIILLDVQPDQLQQVRTTLQKNGYAYRDIWPVVTMRISAMRGKTLSEWRRDPEAGISRWVYTWEFRSSWRDSLLDNETVIAGEFTPTHDGTEPIPVSLSENIREDFNVQLGDEIIWDVQGVPVRSFVDSVREVDWSPGRQNFTVVFPQGSLEGAPMIYLVTLQVADRTEAAALQRLVAVEFPNVSLIDLTLIFETFREVLSRAGFVIQFMAAFTIFTGLVVLLSAIYTSRYQRAREAVLLRTMGASPGMVRTVMSIEYILIGALAGTAGTVLALSAAAALQVFIFNIPFAWSPLEAVASIAFITFATWLTGMLNSRSVLRQSPLAVLRNEN